jgi:hypothetical protein
VHRRRRDRFLQEIFRSIPHSGLAVRCISHLTGISFNAVTVCPVIRVGMLYLWSGAQIAEGEFRGIQGALCKHPAIYMVVNDG